MARDTNAAKAASRVSAPAVADPAVAVVAAADPATAATADNLLSDAGAAAPGTAVDASGAAAAAPDGGDPAAVTMADQQALLDAVAALSSADRPQFGEIVSELILRDLEVTAVVSSRRRAGRKFSEIPTIIPAAEVTEDLVKALDADPLLKLRNVFSGEATES